jgi:hypothetical protein
MSSSSSFPCTSSQSSWVTLLKHFPPGFLVPLLIWPLGQYVLQP